MRVGQASCLDSRRRGSCQKTTYVHVIGDECAVSVPVRLYYGERRVHLGVGEQAGVARSQHLGVGFDSQGGVRCAREGAGLDYKPGMGMLPVSIAMNIRSKDWATLCFRSAALKLLQESRIRSPRPHSRA